MNANQHAWADLIAASVHRARQWTRRIALIGWMGWACASWAWAGALVVPAGAHFTLPAGKYVYKTVDIGSNAKVFLTGDTELVVSGDGVTSPTFELESGATIYAGNLSPYYAPDGTGDDGVTGAAGGYGSFSSWSAGPPVVPPVYTPPATINGANGTAGENGAAPPFGTGRYPNLVIRVDGNALLGASSQILLDTYYNNGISDSFVYNPNGGAGGNGGNGGKAGALQAFGYTGSGAEIQTSVYNTVGGNGGNGGKGGNGPSGVAGISGGSLRLIVDGDLRLAGEVMLSASGNIGGHGGAAGEGGFPGDPESGQTSSGDYGTFGANGAAGNGAAGGAGGAIDVDVSGDLNADSPYNTLSASGTRGGYGGRGSDTGYQYFGSARTQSVLPAPTAPGEGGAGGNASSIRVRVGGYLGTSLFCSATGGNGGDGGDLGYNWGTEDWGTGTTSFPCTGKDGKMGGTGGDITIECQKGIHGLIAVYSKGGKGGDGGTGGTVPGLCPGFYVSGGKGGNGGTGGRVALTAPSIDGETYLDATGGAVGTGGAGTLAYAIGLEGSTGATGTTGTTGTLTTTLTEPADLFPMTLRMETVPLDLAQAAVGDTVKYHCVFTNSNTGAINNFVLRTDPLNKHCEAIQNSAGTLGSWNVSTGVFETTTRTLAALDYITLDFSVTITAPFVSGDNVINGVSALGQMNGEDQLDHVLVSLPMAKGTATAPNAPTVSSDASATTHTLPTWTWTPGGGGNGTFRYQFNTTDPDWWTTTTAAAWTPGSALADGTYTLYVQERDNAGDWSEAGSYSVTVDTTPPNAPAVKAVSTVDGWPFWTWVGGGGGNGTFRYQLDSTSGAWTTTTGLSYAPTEDLALGEHVLYVRERDAAGNWSAMGSCSITLKAAAEHWRGYR